MKVIQRTNSTVRLWSWNDRINYKIPINNNLIKKQIEDIIISKGSYSSEWKYKIEVKKLIETIYLIHWKNYNLIEKEDY